MEEIAIIKLISNGQKITSKNQEHIVLKSGKVLSFGRNKWCTRILRFPEASKTHFVITSHPNSKKVWIIDQSQNGTIIRNIENNQKIELNRDIYLLKNGQNYEISLYTRNTIDSKDLIEELILTVEVHSFLIHWDVQKERNLILKWCKNLGLDLSRIQQDKKLEINSKVLKIVDRNYSIEHNNNISSNNNNNIEQPYNIRTLNKVIDSKDSRKLPFLNKKK